MCYIVEPETLFRIVDFLRCFRNGTTEFVRESSVSRKPARTWGIVVNSSYHWNADGDRE